MSVAPRLDESRWPHLSDEQEALATSLLLAIRLIKSSGTWVKYRPKFGKNGKDPYYWCFQGWRANNFQGYGWAVSNALRPHVPDGDLTLWWEEGRSRKEMIQLFTTALEAL